MMVKVVEGIIVVTRVTNNQSSENHEWNKFGVISTDRISSNEVQYFDEIWMANSGKCMTYNGASIVMHFYYVALAA